MQIEETWSTPDEWTALLGQQKTWEMSPLYVMVVVENKD